MITTMGEPGLPQPSVHRLVLADFRTYPALDLRLDSRTIVLTGENGAGKTNLIEAISLLSPGRGLRRAELGECARIGGSGTFAVSVEIATRDGMIQLGTGTESQPDGNVLRRFRLNREPVASIRNLALRLNRFCLPTPKPARSIGPPVSLRRIRRRRPRPGGAPRGPEPGSRPVRTASRPSWSRRRACSGTRSRGPVRRP